MTDLHDAAAAELWAAMDSIHETMKDDGLVDGEFTTVDYAKRYNLTTRAAARELDRAHQAKMVTRRMIKLGGRDVWAYRMTAKE